MSNFAATLGPILERLSPLVKATSEIIDAYSNANYVFLDVSVGFRIRFPLRFFGLGYPIRLMDSGAYWKYDDLEPLRDVEANDEEQPNVDSQEDAAVCNCYVVCGFGDCWRGTWTPEPPIKARWSCGLPTRPIKTSALVSLR